jgi:microcystin-dependent protein
MDSIILTNENQNLAINYKFVNPVGAVTCYAGVNTPQGWLFCNGSEVSKTSYSALYSVIGDRYGVAGNSDNFVLPDLTQKFPLGKSVSNNLGDSSGNQTIILSTNQLPSHTHTGTTDISGSHVHTGTTSTNGTHNHTATDSGHSHGYLDAYFAENQAEGPNNVFGTSASTDNDNSYRYRPEQDTITSTGYANITVDNNGSHSHSLNVDSNGNHTHTFTTGSTGSGSSINIMNPYLVLNYIIKY